ncbi:MAG: hypothetical protein ABSC46_06700 [Candidatus Limnocylindrales bacterium]|jgi:hypothetical protein
MRARFARLGLAATLAMLLALASASTAAAAVPKPTGQWVTYFASRTLRAGTWLPGTYWAHNVPTDQPLFTLHESWTLPTPYSTDQPAPLGESYYVDPAAPAYPGVALLRINHIEAVTSGTVRHPTCSMVTSFRPAQRTRIVVAMVGDVNDPVTRAVWNKWMATTTFTATLDAGGGATVPLRPIKTELVPANVFADLCRPAFLR